MKCQFNGGKIEVEFPEGFEPLDEEGTAKHTKVQKTGTHQKDWDLHPMHDAQREMTLAVASMKRAKLFGRLASLDSLLDSHMKGTIAMMEGAELIGKTTHTVDGHEGSASATAMPRMASPRFPKTSLPGRAIPTTCSRSPAARKTWPRETKCSRSSSRR